MKTSKITYATVATLNEALSPKELNRMAFRGINIKWQKSVKTEQSVKIYFFENLLLLKSKNAELTKVI